MVIMESIEKIEKKPPILKRIIGYRCSFVKLLARIIVWLLARLLARLLVRPLAELIVWLLARPLAQPHARLIARSFHSWSL